MAIWSFALTRVVVLYYFVLLTDCHYSLTVTRKYETTDSFMLTSVTDSVKYDTCSHVFDAKAEGELQAVNGTDYTTIRCTCSDKETFLTITKTKDSGRTKCVKMKNIEKTTGCNVHDMGSNTMAVHSYRLTEAQSDAIVTLKSEDYNFEKCLQHSNDILLGKALVWNDTQWSKFNEQVIHDMHINTSNKQLEWNTSTDRHIYNGLLLMLFIQCESENEDGRSTNFENCLLLRFDGSRSYPLDPPLRPTLPPTASIQVPRASPNPTVHPSTPPTSSISTRHSSTSLRLLSTSYIHAASHISPSSVVNPPPPSTVFRGFSTIIPPSTSVLPTIKSPRSDSNITVALAVSLSSILVLVFLIVTFILVFRTRKRNDRSGNQPHPYETPGQPSTVNKKQLGGCRGKRFNRAFVMGSGPYYESPIDGKQPVNEGDYAIPVKEGAYTGLQQSAIEAEDKYQPLNAATLQPESFYHHLDLPNDYHDYKELEKE